MGETLMSQSTVGEEIKEVFSNQQDCSLAEEVFHLIGQIFCSNSLNPSLAVSWEGRVVAVNEHFTEYFSCKQEVFCDGFISDTFFKGWILNKQGSFLSPVQESLSTNTCCNLVHREVLGKPVLELSSLISDNQGQYLGILIKYFPRDFNKKNTYLAEKIRNISNLKDKIRNWDIYTMSHSKLVGWYAYAIASRLDLNNRVQNLAFIAGLLHDVGKVRIPKKILNKNGPLTQSEYEIVKIHPHVSRRILEKYKINESILSSVTHHHERYDGSGYPGGLKGEKIPLLSRILAVADAFEAMTAERPYRQANCISLACSELKCKVGEQFDPIVVEVFLDLVARHIRCFNQPCFPSRCTSKWW